MAESKLDTSQFVKVEAPLQVARGQNLYDQPPFNLALAHVLLDCHIDIREIRIILGRLSQFSETLMDELDLRSGDAAYFAELAGADLGKKLKPWRTPSQTTRVIPSEEGTKASQSLLEDLSPYPWWFRYIGRYNDQFNLDGNWDKRTTPSPIKSYASYARERLGHAAALNRALDLQGLREIFPQDFRTTSTSIVVSRELVAKGVTSLGALAKPK